jgi:D-sedoheptulose 7-phosphate isomerase
LGEPIEIAIGIAIEKHGNAKFPNRSGIESMFNKNLQEHLSCFNDLAELSEPVEQVAERLTACIRRGGKIMICGNGGSAADSQHFSTEIVGRFLRDRRAMPAIALTTDTSILTAIGNDFGFTEVYSRQIEALGRSDDSLIALSTSGSSVNIIQAVTTAKNNHITTIGLTGADGGKLSNMVDIAIKVPARNTPRIQEVHIFILHYWAECIEAIL